MKQDLKNKKLNELAQAKLIDKLASREKELRQSGHKAEANFLQKRIQELNSTNPYITRLENKIQTLAASKKSEDIRKAKQLRKKIAGLKANSNPTRHRADG